MKKFRKNKQGFYICEECEKIFKNKICLAKHNIKLHNQNMKQYFDKWIKEENEGICKICGKQTFLIRTDLGYKKCCSKECQNKYIYTQTKNGCIKKYGVKSTLQVKEFREKGKQTKKEKYGDENYCNPKKIKQSKLERYGNKNYRNEEKIKQTKKYKYGDENYNNREKSKQTKQEKYGDENYNNREKSKQTCLERYGKENYTNYEKSKQTCLERYNVENPWQVKEFKEKAKQTKRERYGDENYINNKKTKQTCLKTYGIEHPNQNKEQYNKGLKTRLLIHYYKDTNLYYQGSYELDFIEKHYDKIDIENGFSFKYIKDGKNHVYHSDFYIPSKNLIIEIKNMYLVNRDKEEIELKKMAVLNVGYNFIIIVNKNYKEFNTLFS